MTIIRAKSVIDAYREQSRASSIHELSGRSGKKFYTQFINKKIIKKLKFKPTDRVVDIGCGDGTLLYLICDKVKECVGIAPTNEEILRLQREYDDLYNLNFGKGISTHVPLISMGFEKVICNGVFLLLTSKRLALRSMIELSRLCKPGGLVWIGEVLNREEKDYDFGESIIKWLFIKLKKGDLSGFGKSLFRLTFAVFTKEPFVIHPKKLLVLSNEEIKDYAEKAGLVLLWSSKHRRVNRSGRIFAVDNRTDYLFKKRKRRDTHES